MGENVLIMQNALLEVIKVYVNVPRNVQTTFHLVKFVPAMEILTKMNVNSIEALVSNRNRSRLCTKALVVSIACLMLLMSVFTFLPSLFSFMSSSISNFSRRILMNNCLVEIPSLVFAFNPSLVFNLFLFLP